MPTAPLRYCLEQGCPALVPHGRSLPTGPRSPTTGPNTAATAGTALPAGDGSETSLRYTEEPFCGSVDT